MLNNVVDYIKKGINFIESLGGNNILNETVFDKSQSIIEELEMCGREQLRNIYFRDNTIFRNKELLLYLFRADKSCRTYRVKLYFDLIPEWEKEALYVGEYGEDLQEIYEIYSNFIKIHKSMKEGGVYNGIYN